MVIGRFCLSVDTRCKKGDVRLKRDGTPMIFWEEQWKPICGHYFWNNQNGAKLFCNRLGYDSAVLSKTSGRYLMDSLRIGQCENGDTLESCSGGCNDYQLGGSCSDNNPVSCEAKHGGKFTVECSGGKNTKRTSCKDKIILINKFRLYVTLNVNNTSLYIYYLVFLRF